MVSMHVRRCWTRFDTSPKRQRGRFRLAAHNSAVQAATKFAGLLNRAESGSLCGVRPRRRFGLVNAQLQNWRAGPIYRAGDPRPNIEHRTSNGLSLFEVIVALVIFVASAAAIGQLVAGGVRGAVRARLESEAVLRCESKMAEVVAGVIQLQSSPQAAFSDNPDWTWSVNVTQAPQPYLFLVEVDVAHGAGGSLGAISYNLRRLIRDPDVSLAAAQQEALMQQQQDQQQQQQQQSQSGASSQGTAGTAR